MVKFCSCLKAARDNRAHHQLRGASANVIHNTSVNNAAYLSSRNESLSAKAE